MTFIGSVASLFLKRASSLDSIKKIIFNYNIYVGGILYLIASLLNIYVLKFLDYSVVLPLTSITYIWTLILSYLILKEKMSIKKVIGVLGIIFGAVLLAI